MDLSLRPELGVSQRLEQTLRLSPAMIQSMEILQLASLDLQEKIEQELEQNPVLELADNEPAAQQETQSDSKEADEEFSRLDDFSESSLSVWEDGAGRFRRRSGAGEEDPKYEALQNLEGKPISLSEHLEGQISFVVDDDRTMELARQIVGNLDEDGYLTDSLGEVLKGLSGFDPPVTEEELEEVLNIVQSLDPPGVGARNLRECLLLQISRESRASAIYQRMAVEMIKGHLDDLGQNRLPKIARELKKSFPDLGEVSVEDVKEAHKVIASLDPRPGRTFGGSRPAYVRPDVIVEKVGDKYEVRVESGYFPRLRLCTEYRSLLDRKNSDKKTSKFLRSKFQDADYLLRAIGMRENTLQRIATVVVSLQEDFLEKGVEYLRPLRLRDVAERLDMHLSTVSRAISGKYLQCPRGIYEMKYFFPGGASSEGGNNESRNSVISKLKDVIGKEDKKRPLSDERLAAELKKMGLGVSRRTVTKYRESQGIPPSRGRKVY